MDTRTSQIEISGGSPRWKRRRLIAAILALLVAAIVPAYLEAVTVAGPSDAPTYLPGDRLLVNHAAYDVRIPYSSRHLFARAAPQRGDMVLFLVPNRDTRGLKRVVAIPGDTVELRDNVLLVNGIPTRYQSQPPADFAWVPAEYKFGQEVAIESGIGADHLITFTPGASDLRTSPPLAVPPDTVYLLGDHRDNSYDSRTFGPLRQDLILGRVITQLTSGIPRGPTASE